jgi:AcrR family transcriptional regulator
MAEQRGSYAKGRAKRDEIVEIALDLFARRGYDRTSVREVARLAGLSQAGLLHHFRSKEELFLEVLRGRDARNERTYDENPDSVSLAGLVEIVRHNAQEPGLVRLYVSLSAESCDPDSPTREFFVTRYARLLADMRADLERRAAAGALPEGADIEAMASLLVAAADGLQIQWLLDPDSFDMGERLQLLSELIGERSADAAGAGAGAGRSEA